MATKKAKKKATKKGKTAAKKRSPAPRPKRTVTRRPKRAAPRKPAVRKAVARKPVARKPAARKTAARKPPATKSERAHASGTGAKSGSVGTPVRRQVRPGHFDPRYEADLLGQSTKRETGPRAFIESPRSVRDDLAEELGEEVIASATSGEDDVEETLDAVVPEEQGGPFVETNADQEFAQGTDASNPRGAKREPFPTT
jgi:hypothetical protein